jgi:hypothetical protein
MNIKNNNAICSNQHGMNLKLVYNENLCIPGWMNKNSEPGIQDIHYRTEFQQSKSERKPG